MQMDAGLKRTFLFDTAVALAASAALAIAAVPTDVIRKFIKFPLLTDKELQAFLDDNIRCGIRLLNIQKSETI